MILDNQQSIRTESQPTSYPCTDVGNMERFVAQHGSYLRSGGTATTWHKWDGKRWKPSSTADIFNLALATVSSIKDEVHTAKASAEAAELHRWATISQGEARIKSMVNMASKHESLLVSPEAFDTDRMKINCNNGIINLKTGELLTRDTSDLVSKIIDIDYIPGTPAPRFNAFIADIFDDDKGLMGWVKRALGYTLTGSVEEQCLMFGLGSGANGKSTLLELIYYIMGDYSTLMDLDTLLAEKKSDIRSKESVGLLKGSRLAVASEVSSTSKLNTAQVKRLSGDENLIGAKLHGASFTFAPQFKLWLLLNHLPFVREGSNAFWRRAKVVPFAKQFSGDKLDTRLPQKLRAEKEGVLAWLVEGAVEWHQQLNLSKGASGLGECKAVEEQIAIYKYDNDLTSRFLEDCTQQSKGTWIAARELYDSYGNWCRHNDIDNIVTENIFSSRMQERGLKKKRTRAGYIYEDLVAVSSNHYSDF